MGYKTASTRRTTAASAVSSQAVIVNNGNSTPGGGGSFSAVGSTIAANTSISLGVTTVGQTSASTVTTVSAGPIISNIAYLDANNAVISGDIAVSTAGGNILITGSGFVANSNVYINNSLVTNTFISSTQIRAICPAASAGNVSLMIFTPTNVGTISSTGVRYSGTPSWTTAAASAQNATAANIALVASSDSALTYTLQSGSTLPTGITLNSAGYLVGTPTGYTVNTSSSFVIIATDSEGQAAQQTINFTITVADPQFPYTALLLNGETSVTPFINDASNNSFGLTIAGDARADKFSPYRGDGYYSTYFNGTSAVQTPAASITSIIGTNGVTSASTFTIEGWIYQTQRQTYTTFPCLMGDLTPSSTFCYFGFGPTSTGLLQFFWYDGGNKSATGGTTIPLNNWTHIAVSISSGAIKLFVNGNLETITGTSALTNATGTTGYFAMGMEASGASGANAFFGYVSNVRVVKSALYSTAFTPSTTPLTAVANTGLLMAQSNRLIDTSANAFALTLTGTPQVSPATPFASSSYAAYGSAYFDGTGDWLLGPTSSNLILTADFTVEAWINPANVSGTKGIMGIFGVGGGWYMGLNGATLRMSNGLAGGDNDAGTVVANTWTHVAATRSGNSLRMFINGVQVNTTTDVSALNWTISNPIYLGQINTASWTFTGYIADARVIKGTALYTTNFTPPTAPLTAVANTQLLTCQYNGGATNYGIIDNGPYDFPITRVGTATTQGTFSPFSPTGWSYYFNGTSGLQTPASSLTNIIGSNALTTSTFTIECWINPTVRTGDTGGNMVGDMAPAAGTANWSWGPRNDGKLDFYWYNGGGIHCTGSSTIPLNTWTHIALVIANTSIKMFVNGVQETLSGTTTLTAPGSSLGYLGIGMWNNGASGNTMYAGYISNMRIVKSALYSSTFTPSTSPLTAVTNTSFLTAQSNRFLDTSSNAYTLTATSIPSVQAFSPFSPTAAYSPSLHGGSAYFNGTSTAGLTLPGSPLFNFGSTVAWTVEAWVYPTALPSAAYTIISQGEAQWRLAINSTGTMSWTFGTSSTSTTTDTFKINQWNHIAVAYNGTSYWLYINGNTSTSGGAALPPSDSTSVMYIGRNPNGPTWFMTGHITDIRVTHGACLYPGGTAFALPTAPLTASGSTVLLCNFTNGGIIDAHSSSVNETVGGTQLSTSVKKFGNASMSFVAASSQYLKPTANPLYAFGTGDFTVETWVYILSHADYRTIFDIRTSDLDANGLVFGTNAAGQAYFYYAGTFRIAAGSISTNTWTHLAWVRQNGVFTSYVNGSSVGTASVAINVTNTAPTIGKDWNSLYYCNGYMDDFRVTKGFARYTANFTPPTSASLGQ